MDIYSFARTCEPLYHFRGPVRIEIPIIKPIDQEKLVKFFEQMFGIGLLIDETIRHISVLDILVKDITSENDNICSHLLTTQTSPPKKR